MLTHKQLKMYGCIISIVVTYGQYTFIKNAWSIFFFFFGGGGWVGGMGGVGGGNCGPLVIT